MAELHQILGSVLRDVAQARMISDVYSRNISTYYEQDPLLRRFPTPRTEIDEVEFDLKFVLDGVQSNLSQNEEREVSSAPLFNSFSFDLAENFFDALNDHSRNLFSQLDEETKRRIQSNDPTQESGWGQFEYRIYVKQSLVLYLQRNRDRIIQQGKLEIDTTLSEIEGILHSWIRKIFENAEKLSESDFNVLEGQVFKAINLKAQLSELEDPISQIENLQADLKLNVAVTLDKLMEAPPSIISTIRIKSRVRNYLWTKIDHEGHSQRHLNPE